jgi:hypothetical protein
VKLTDKQSENSISHVYKDPAKSASLLYTPNRSKIIKEIADQQQRRRTTKIKLNPNSVAVHNIMHEDPFKPEDKRRDR